MVPLKSHPVARAKWTWVLAFSGMCGRTSHTTHNVASPGVI